MINWDKQNLVSKEVIHSVERQIEFDSSDICYLIEQASRNKRKRIRFCSHENPAEQVHEMFIVQPQNAYIRPHKHKNKIESMLVLKGEVDYVVFNEDGSIRKVIQMGELGSSKTFYNSLREATYHTQLIRSEWLVFLEATKGPFDKKDTIFPEWCPEENDTLSVVKYLNNLEGDIKNRLLHT